MAIQTRTVTARFSEPYGDPIENVRVVIQLRGLGNSPNGAVAPESQEKFSDASGLVTFELWENNQSYSDTYYEVSSSHPTSGKAIHRNEVFRVYDSDANLAELISLSLVPVDANQALIDQVAADRAAAASSATTAQNAATNAVVAQGEAEVAESQAKQHRDDAGDYANDAQQSASNASSSEIAASGHKDAAAGSASAAVTSENNAQASETSALASKNQAASSASDADDSRVAAAASESNSANSEAAAESHANDALGYKNAAQSASATATTKAGEAVSSAAAAAASESAAGDHASDARDYRDAAQSAASTAQSAAATVNNLYYGTGAPSSGIGDDGDSYIEKDGSGDSVAIYGPKTAGAWGSPTSLIGPEGPPGSPGSGSGDVNGPASTTVGNIALFDNTSGTMLGEGPALSSLATAASVSALSGSLSDVATSGDYNDLDNRPTLGSAAAQDSSAFASAAQGAKADTALQQSNVATTAEAQAGTVGKILDAAGGHTMAAYWGIPFPKNLPSVDIDTVVTGLNYTCYGALHPNANAGDNPFPDLGGAFSLRVTGEGLGVPGKYCLQIASKLSSDEPITRIRSIANSNWSPWTTIWTDKNLSRTGSPTDLTTGSVPSVGWLGLGDPIALTSSDDLYNLPPLGINCTVYYDYTGGNSPANTPESGAAQVTRTFHTSFFEKLEVYRPGSGKTFVDYKISGAWVGWQDAGSGGAQEGVVVVDYGVVGSGGDETVTIDLEGADERYDTRFVMDFADSNGTVTLNVINTPPATSNWSCHFAIKRAGRKNMSLPAGWSWANGAEPTFSASASYYGLFNVQHWSFMGANDALMGFVLNSNW